MVYLKKVTNFSDIYKATLTAIDEVAHGTHILVMGLAFSTKMGEGP